MNQSQKFHVTGCNIVFITVQGLNKCHVAPYTDIEFQLTKHKTLGLLLPTLTDVMISIQLIMIPPALKGLSEHLLHYHWTPCLTEHSIFKCQKYTFTIQVLFNDENWVHIPIRTLNKCPITYGLKFYEAPGLKIDGIFKDTLMINLFNMHLHDKSSQEIIVFPKKARVSIFQRRVT